MYKNLSEFIGSKIKHFREIRNLTQEEVAEELGTTRQTISRYETGDRKANQDVLFELANLFNITIDDFFPHRKNINDINCIYNQLNEFRKSAVYDFANYQLDEQNNKKSIKEESVIYLRNSNQSAAGTMIDPDNGEDYEVLPSSMVPHGADEIVEITGNSMEPLISKGEKVFLRHQPTVENGEIAIVRIENEGVTCKRFYFKDDTIILKSENEEYKDMLFDPSQVTVLGKVLK